MSKLSIFLEQNAGITRVHLLKYLESHRCFVRVFEDRELSILFNEKPLALK